MEAEKQKHQHNKQTKNESQQLNLMQLVIPNWDITLEQMGFGYFLILTDQNTLNHKA